MDQGNGDPVDVERENFLHIGGIAAPVTVAPYQVGREIQLENGAVSGFASDIPGVDQIVTFF